MVAAGAILVLALMVLGILIVVVSEEMTDRRRDAKFARDVLMRQAQLARRYGIRS